MDTESIWRITLTRFDEANDTPINQTRYTGYSHMPMDTDVVAILNDWNEDDYCRPEDEVEIDLAAYNFYIYRMPEDDNHDKQIVVHACHKSIELQSWVNSKNGYDMIDLSNDK